VSDYETNLIFRRSSSPLTPRVEMKLGEFNASCYWLAQNSSDAMRTSTKRRIL
jgi:hypothetical protein